MASLLPLLLALLLLAAPAAAGTESPVERTVGTAEALGMAARPHPYADHLRREVLNSMGPGTPWGRYRDPEDGRRYVGSDACLPCHPTLHEEWSRTKMATAFGTLAGFKGGIMLNDARCLSCHTTGYDPGRENGGFDDGVPTLAGVGCEGCHGAGSLMVERKDRRWIRVSTAADFCGRCHSERYGRNLCFPEYDEWLTSRHARGLTDLRRDPGADDSCLGCHSADAVVRGSATLATATEGVTCQACHDAMRRTFPELPDNNQLRRPKDELCASCHSDRGRGPSQQVPHAPQAELFAGRGGAEFPGEEYPGGPMNADLVRGCLHCHAVADRSIPTPYQGHTFLPNILACRRCHPDLETFDRRGVQGEIRDLLMALERRLGEIPPERRGGFYDMALHNLRFVTRDRSLGIHNTLYARKLLVDSLRYADR